MDTIIETAKGHIKYVLHHNQDGQASVACNLIFTKRAKEIAKELKLYCIYHYPEHTYIYSRHPLRKIHDRDVVLI